jgi:hypothetical protein
MLVYGGANVVTVHADAVQVDSTSNTLGGRFNTREVVDLPMNGPRPGIPADNRNAGRWDRESVPRRRWAAEHSGCAEADLLKRRGLPVDFEPGDRLVQMFGKLGQAANGSGGVPGGD